MRSFFSRRLSVAVILAVSAAPALLMAQRGGRGGAGPRGGGPGPGPIGPNSVSPLIDMRRELDLTPRQVATLDSIERAISQRNSTTLERLRVRRDSLLGNRDPRDLSAEDRQNLRAKLDALEPMRQELFRNDSTARAAALRVLTDSQRVRVRELQAEQRGFAMGRMTGQLRGRGFGGPQGMGGRGMGLRGRMGGRGAGGGGGRGFGGRRGRFGGMGPQGFGPRFRRGVGGGFGGGMGPGGMGPRGMGPGGMGPGAMGPRGAGPGVGRGMGGRLGAPGLRGRFGALGADSLRSDSLQPPPRRPRRPPAPTDSIPQ